MLDPDNRPRFGDITVVYGARFPGLLLYKEELAAWEQRDDIRMHITVDGTDDPNWKYNVGFVPSVTKQKAPESENSYAIICGPPDYDQVHPAGPDGIGVPSGADHFQPGDADEVRDWDLWTVQYRH